MEDQRVVRAILEHLSLWDEPRPQPDMPAVPRALDEFDYQPWYSAALNSAGRAAVSCTGATQLRLRFTKDDNNDLGADCVKFSSGNAPVAARPQLIVEYYVP